VAIAAATALTVPASAGAVTVTPASIAVRAAAFSSAPTPKITGTAKVGQTLTASPGAWSPAPTTFRYQWYRNGVAIQGATAKTRLLNSYDLGKSLSVKVTAVRSGYTTVTKGSGAVTVSAGVLTPATPKITGTASVGSTVKASAGAWGPAPVTVKYQWYRNGAPISGATGATRVLNSYDASASITVKVTVSKAGYTTASRTSAAVKVAADLKAWANSKWGSFTAKTVTGTGDKVISLPAGAKSGLISAKTSYSGLFFVTTLDGSNEPVDYPISVYGSYDGTTGFGLSSYDRGQATKLQIDADGPWSVTIKPAATAPVISTGVAQAAKSDRVYLYGGPADSLYTKYTPLDGYGTFFVSQHFSPTSYDLTIIEGGDAPYSGSHAFKAGPSLIEVESTDTSWSIKF
jgi:hypothetical protein